MDATGQFTENIENLKLGTTYFVRCVGDNGVCLGEGEVEQFTTQGGLNSIQPETQETSFRSRVRNLIERIFGFDNLTDEQLESLKEQNPILSRIISR
jgi:hypothetical protein